MSKLIIALLLGFGVAFAAAFGLNSLYAAAGARGGFESFFVPAFLGVFTAYIYGNLAGNRRQQNASAQDKAQALSFSPPQGHGQLIVYREGFLGMAAGLNVDLDERTFAQLKSPRFTSIYVPAGVHSLTAGFGGFAGPQNRKAHAQVDFKGGEVLVVKATLAMGAIQNSVKLDTAQLDDGLKRKLAGMRMVKPS
jgi:hypothetical protein